MQSLLLSSVSWIADVAFFVIVIGGLLYGVKKGFISGICKLAGTLFAIVFALFFCVSFEAFLERMFGMTSAISDGLVGAFSKIGAFGVDISGQNLETALAEAGVPAFLADIVVNAFAEMQIPEGTTIAMLISPVVAHWIAVVISFVLLVILIKLGTWLIDKIFSGIAESVKPIRILNRFLGGILGLAKALIFVFIVLAICSLIGNESINAYLQESAVVGKIYTSDWFTAATSYLISFEWLHSYVGGSVGE